MKKVIQLVVVAVTMFAAAAGASLALQRQKKSGADPAPSTEHESQDEKSDATEPRESSHAPAPRTPIVDDSPTHGAGTASYSPGVEETVRLASSLRERAALVREREDRLAARSRQLELVAENIRSERQAIDELREELDAALKAGEDHLAEIRRQRDELDIRQQTIEGRVTEMTGHEKDNIKKMASVYDNMAAESAAKIIQHMADSGTMDTAVKLLASMRERQAAKILAEMPDPALAAQLSERLKDFKHPRGNSKE